MPFMLPTVAVLNNGTVVRALHELNISTMFVTAAVLYKGTTVKDRQFLNMFCMFVAAAVLNNGAVTREEHSTNILLMFVTDAVLSSTTACSSRKFSNKLLRLVTLPIERTATRSHIATLTFAVVPPKVMLVKLGLPTSISNQPDSYACRPLVVFFTFMLIEVSVPPFGVTVTMACL